MVVISQKCTSWSEKNDRLSFQSYLCSFWSDFSSKSDRKRDGLLDYFFDRFYAPFAIENSRKFKSSIPSREKTCMDTAYLLINPTWQNTWWLPIRHDLKRNCWSLPGKKAGQLLPCFLNIPVPSVHCQQHRRSQFPGKSRHTFQPLWRNCPFFFPLL